MSYREYENLDISDTEEDLFASPSKSPRPSRQQASIKTEDASYPTQSQSRPQPRNTESQYDAEAGREAGLRKELAQLQQMNSTLESTISALSVAKSNMSTVSTTVGSASTLLNTWTRILSQTEHNQKLILNPHWKGATQDAVEAENDVIMKKQAEERRQAEEMRRREEVRRREEDEERQRQAGTAVASARGSARGRARAGRVAGTGYGRVTPGNSGTSGSRYVGVGGQGGMGLNRTASQRGGTGVGRGAGTARGRARGSSVR